jgi:hypothetical protein
MSRIAAGGSAESYPRPRVACPKVRAMFLIWLVLIFGGIAYFSVIGLTHH